MSRHAGTTASAFALVLTVTVLASSAAQAFGPRPFWPTRPRPTSPLPILLPIPNVDGQPGQEPKLTTTGPVTPRLGLQASKPGRSAYHKVSGRVTALAVDPADPNSDGAPFTFTSDPRSTGLSQPKLRLQTGGIHLPAMTARVPTITVRGSR